jgi:ParB family chromosome partitioning protein
MKRKVLGKGLDALIPRGEDKRGGEEIPLGKIRENPRQPRRDFNPASLRELVESVREKGVLQPILVRKVATGYELIAGERRLRAAKEAGLEKIPVLVRNISEQEALEWAIIENVQREDLNPMEVAEGFFVLAKDHLLSQEEISRKVGKDRSTVANFLRLTRLPSNVKQAIREEKISMGHAKVLMGLLKTKELDFLFERIVDENLSVREAEKLSRIIISKIGKGRIVKKKLIPSHMKHFLEMLQRKIGTRVGIRGTSKKGVLEIHYSSQEELDRIVDRIKR